MKDGAVETAVLGIRHDNPAHARRVVVDWTLGNACNFACSYCPAELHDGSLGWQAADRVLWMFEELRAHYCDRLGHEVWLQFTGGEPSMHPKITTLLTAAAGHGFRTSMISNGSRTPRFWEKVRPMLDRMILTYHDEYVDHDAFVAVADCLSETMPVHVNLTVNPDRFDVLVAKGEAIAEAVPRITLTLKPLRVGFGETLYDYTPAQLARLGSRTGAAYPHDRAKPRGRMREERADGAGATRDASHFLLTDTNRWRGWRCEAGIESLRISGDGRVYRSVCSVGGSLGSINDTVYLPMTAVRCDRERCACIGDILITKTRVG